ncbi:hypothetical protein DH2020_007319 [Rehmannia glutinosa]|uniref:KIB1-4 beta-propeller domain-containing protein n=1 Tax=Rehmannia glutinosa TaxID=99300 RepID=A0ABR0TYR2_REHGL
MKKENGNNKQPPLLLTSHEENYEKQSFYRFLENRYRTTSIPILCNKRILASTHEGWVVLVHSSNNDCCLWNPVSMEIIELPRLDKSYLYNKCILSKPPTEPDCHILFNSACTMHQSFCKIGDDEFVHHSTEEEEIQLMAIASVQGKIYGVRKFYGIIDDYDDHYTFVTINLLATSTIELKPLLLCGGQPWTVPQPSPNWVTWNESCLIESPCGGELLLVNKMYSSSNDNDGLGFRVFRVDINGMVCSELENIGEQTIFIGYYGSGFCGSSYGRIKPNSIYYTNEEGRNLSIYCLDDWSKTSFLPSTAVGRYVTLTYWVEHELIDQLIE